MPRRGNIDGTVAGDVFSFRHTAEGRCTGELTVNGDEMTGQVAVPYTYRVRRIVLRRVGSSPRCPAARPASDPVLPQNPYTAPYEELRIRAR